MSIEVLQMFTVQCDCCKENYSDDHNGWSCWSEFDSARQQALDKGWIEKAAESEHDDLMHFCPKCFTIDDEDIITTKSGIKFQN